MREFFVSKGEPADLFHVRQVADVNADQTVPAHASLYPVSPGDGGNAAGAITEIVDKLRRRISARQISDPIKPATGGHHKHGLAIFE